MPEIILSNANENWYIILYDLFSRLWYIATCGPFCKEATHIALTRRGQAGSVTPVTRQDICLIVTRGECKAF